MSEWVGGPINLDTNKQAKSTNYHHHNLQKKDEILNEQRKTSKRKKFIN